MDREQAIALAAKLMRMTETEAAGLCCQLKQENAWFFSVPEKGGDSLIVSDDGSVLYANSSVGFDDHVKAFRDGIRTPIEAFEES